MAENEIVFVPKYPKNGSHVKFETNILIFNPGWDGNAQKLAKFTDVRELQRQLKARGVPPASLVAVDPDGNPILLDQHV